MVQNLKFMNDNNVKGGTQQFPVWLHHKIYSVYNKLTIAIEDF